MLETNAKYLVRAVSGAKLALGIFPNNGEIPMFFKEVESLSLFHSSSRMKPD